MMISTETEKWPADAQALEEAIAGHEQEAGPLKRGTEARILWNDERKKDITPYSIVYLHGFNASRGEGDPVHKRIAQKFGCNLYLSRIYGHGVKQKTHFLDLSPQKLIHSAEDACRIGQQIGERVLVMGTSTGGSLALHLAASSEFAPFVDGLILYSPLVHLYGIQSLMFENIVGRSLLEFCPGKNFTIRSFETTNGRESDIWYKSYALNGPLALGKTVQKIMRHSTYKKIFCPTFIGYYYGNTHNHDNTVSTSSIRRMACQLNTPPENLRLVNFPRAGTHVICSSLLSNAVEKVTNATENFLRDLYF